MSVRLGLVSVAMLGVSLLAVFPAQAQMRLTASSVAASCPDVPGGAVCPDIAEQFLSTQRSDDDIVNLSAMIAETGSTPKVTRKICENAADGVRVLAGGVSVAATEQQLIDLANAMCRGTQTASINLANLVASLRSGNGGGGAIGNGGGANGGGGPNGGGPNGGGPNGGGPNGGGPNGGGPNGGGPNGGGPNGGGPNGGGPNGGHNGGGHGHGHGNISITHQNGWGNGASTLQSGNGNFSYTSQSGVGNSSTTVQVN